MQLIKFKILALPRLPMWIPWSDKCDNYIEEIVWSEILSIYNPSVANRVVSPVEEKVSALLALEAIHPITKKAAMRVLDKLRSMNGYLKSLESVELDDCRMVWIEVLSHVALSAVIAIEDFIKKKQQFTERSWMRPFGGFLSAFGKLIFEDKLVVEMDKIYAEIQNLLMHRPTEFSRGSPIRCQMSTVPSPSPPTMQELDLASFGDDDQEMITRLLTDDKGFRVIPITGMEGIGKTTLAKLIFNHKVVIDHFPFALGTSNGYRIHVRHKENIMEYDISQVGYVQSYNEMMQRLEPLLIDNRSLIVPDDSYFFH